MPRLHSSAALALLLATASLTAQGPDAMAYPQETLRGSNGNLAPFGISSTNAIAEGRAQILIRADHLPAPGGVLLGLSVHCQNSGTLTYQSLDIDISHTTVNTLGPTFAQNAPQPWTVLSLQNQAVTFNGSQWYDFLFTQPFVHDGVSNLVIESRKVVVPQSRLYTMTTVGNPIRTDLPNMIYEFGNQGSGASQLPTARFAAAPLQVRLLWAGVPTLSLKSDRFTAGTGNTFALGQPFDVMVRGTPGSFVLLLAGTGLTQASLPPVIGTWWVNGSTVLVGTLSPSRELTIAPVVPANPALVGLYVTWQAGVIDAASSLPYWTNAVDMFVNA